MEPLSLTASAIATLVLTKALEKTGEKLGEKALEQGGRLMELLKHKSPETASAIELVAQRPELAEQQPLDYSEAVLVEKVETVAKAEPEIASAIRDLANTVKSQPQYMQQINKIAETIEKIGNVNQNSTIENQTFNQTF